MKENFKKEAFLLEKTGLMPKVLKDRKRKSLEALYLTKKSEELIKIHWYKKVRRAGQVLSVFLILGILSIIQSRMKPETLFDGTYLNRPEQGEICVDLKIYGGEMEESKVTVEIPGMIQEEEKEVTEEKEEGKEVEIKKSFLEIWEEAYLEEQKDAKEKKYVPLPKSIDGKNIYYEEIKENGGGIFFLLGIIGAGLGFFSIDQKLMEEEKKREQQLSLDYPEIISKFILLLGAGMTITGAWEKISKRYVKNKKEQNIKLRYGYEEMVITWQQIANGIPEVRAFEEYGKRVKRVEYLKFSTLISQNLRKGSKEILQLLELEASEAFERRKELTKKQGEEAGTKLLLPMMIMLVLVFAIILIPAFMGF